MYDYFSKKSVMICHNAVEICYFCSSTWLKKLLSHVDKVVVCYLYSVVRNSLFICACALFLGKDNLNNWDNFYLS